MGEMDDDVVPDSPERGLSEAEEVISQVNLNQCRLPRSRQSMAEAPPPPPKPAKLFTDESGSIHGAKSAPAKVRKDEKTGAKQISKNAGYPEYLFATNLTIPRAKEVKTRTETFWVYEVVLVLDDGSRVTSDHRFSAFADFHKEWKTTYPNINHLTLPAKGSTSNQVIADRCHELESYLRQMCEVTALVYPVSKFLNCDENALKRSLKSSSSNSTTTSTTNNDTEDATSSMMRQSTEFSRPSLAAFSASSISSSTSSLVNRAGAATTSSRTLQRISLNDFERSQSSSMLEGATTHAAAPGSSSSARSLFASTVASSFSALSGTSETASTSASGAPPPPPTQHHLQQQNSRSAMLQKVSAGEFVNQQRRMAEGRAHEGGAGATQGGHNYGVAAALVLFLYILYRFS